MKYVLKIAFLLLLYSCSQSDNQKKQERFTNYFQSCCSSTENINNNSFFVVEPTCFSCSKGILDMLKDIHCTKLIILSIGPITKENEDTLKLIAGTRKIYFDKSFRVVKYQIDIEKGLFTQIENSKCIYYKSFIDYDSLTVKYINQNSLDLN
jgi:hypothetical protein